MCAEPGTPSVEDMPSLRPLSGLPLSDLVSRVRTWPVETQLGARRNAMIASTTLAARRAERLDVEEFFAAREPRSTRPVAAQR